MARIKGSAIVGQISGMVGGVEFASGKAGMVCKAKRRSRFHTTQREADRTWFLGTMQALWRGTDDYTRAQWISYARQNATTNRFGQAFYMTGFQAMMSYHSLVWDWFNRSASGSSIPLMEPPAKTATTYEFSGYYPYLHAGGMYLIAVPGPWGAWARTILYAARRCTARWNGSTNMRFIGSVTQTGGYVDWRPMFTAAGCDWELQEGETVHLRFVGLGGDSLGWPNSGLRREAVVIH